MKTAFFQYPAAAPSTTSATRPQPDEKTHPRLYVAGEISSIYGHLYLEAGNITECFVAGKIAGQNAAAEHVWE
jgi:succinate dehydrogenase/fumarate reductase flavoprotein subunit